MVDTEAILRFKGQDDGLGKILKSNTEQFEKLQEKTTKTVEEFAKFDKDGKKWRKSIESIGSAAKTSGENLGAMYEASSDGYGKFIKGAKATMKVSDILDNRFVSLTARALGFGRATGATADAIGPAADLFYRFADAGSGIERMFIAIDEAERPVRSGLQASQRTLEAWGKSMSGVGAVGEKFSGVLLGMSKSLGAVNRSFGLADTLGDMYLFGESAKEMAGTVGGMLPQAFGAAQNAIAPYLDKMQTWQGRMELAGEAAQKFKEHNSEIVRALAAMTLNIGKTLGMMAQFNQVATFTKNATIEMNNLNHAFGVMQGMGLDTTALDIALSLGQLETSFITNAEAAQQFFNVAVTGFARLQDQLAYTSTLSAGAEAGIDNMGRAMRELVNGPLKNQVTSLQATNALYNAMSAGITELGEAQKFLAAGLKLSGATGADSAQSMELLAKVQKVYGLNAGQAAETAAKLNGVVENGITTFPQLTGGLARTASVAKTSGVNLDEFLGSVAALTKTMSTDDSLTGYASLLQAVAGQGEQSAKEIAALGIRFDTNSIKAKGLTASLKELYDATGGNTEKLKRIIPDALAFQTALVLMTSAADDAVETEKAIAETTSESLDSLFDNRRQSLVQQMTGLVNGFNEVMIDFGESFAPVLQPAVEFLNKLLDMFQSMPDPLKKAIAGMVVFGMSVRKVNNILGDFVGTVATMTKNYLTMRAFSLLMQGTLMKEMNIIKEMITVHGNWSGAVLRLFGVQDGLAKRIQDVTGLTRLQIRVNERLAPAMQQSAQGAKVFREALGELATGGKASQEVLQKGLSKALGSVSSASKQEAAKISEVVASFSQQLSNASQTVGATAMAGGMSLLGFNPEQLKKDAQKTGQEVGGFLFDGLTSPKGGDPSKAMGAMFEAMNIPKEAREDLQKQILNVYAGLDFDDPKVRQKMQEQVGSIFASIDPETIKSGQAMEALGARIEALQIKLRGLGKIPVSQSFQAITGESFNVGKSIAENEKAVERLISVRQKLNTLPPSPLKDQLLKESQQIEKGLQNRIKIINEMDEKVAKQRVEQARVNLVEQIKAERGNIGASDRFQKQIDTAVGLSDVERKNLAEQNQQIKQQSQAQLELLEARKKSLDVVRDSTDVTELNNAATQANTEIAESVESQQKRVGKEVGGTTKRINTLTKTTAINSVGTKANARAQLSLAQIQAATTGQTNTLTAAHAKNTIAQKGVVGATRAQIAITKVQVGLQKTWAAVTSGAATATNLAAGATQALAIGFKSLLVSFGPMLAGFAALGAAFAILQDFIPALGGSAAKTKELGDEIDRVVYKLGEMEEATGVVKTTQESLAINQDKLSTNLGKFTALIAGIPRLFVPVFNTATKLFSLISAGVDGIPALNILKKLGLGQEGKRTIKKIEEDLLSVRQAIAKTADPVLLEKLTAQQAKLEDELSNAPLTLATRTKKFALDAGVAMDTLVDSMSGRTEKIKALTQSIDIGFQETVKKREFQERGLLSDIEARAIQEQAIAEQRAMTADEMAKVLEMEKESIEETIAANEEKINVAKKVLEAEKNPQRRQAIQGQINDLEELSTALNEGNKEIEKYIQNTKSLQEIILNNNAESGQERAVERIREMRGQLTEELNNSDLSEEAKQSGINTFDRFVEGFNTTSVGQRRAAVKLAGNMKNFLDNIAQTEVGELDPNALRADAERYFEAINEAAESGAIGSTQRLEMLEGLLGQTMDIGGIEGSILPPDLLEQIEGEVIGKDKELAEKRIRQHEETLAEIQHAEVTGAKSRIEVAQETAAIQNEILKERLEAQQITTEALKEQYGEESKQYKDAVKELAALERQSAEQRINSQRQVFQVGMQELEYLNKETMDNIVLAETERNAEVQRLLNEGTINQTEADEMRLQSTRRRLNQEIADTEEAIEYIKAQLESLGDADTPYRRELEAQLRGAMQERAGQTVNLAEMEARANEITARKIEEKAEIASMAIDDQILGIQRQSDLYESQINTLENRNRLIQSASQLQQSRDALENFGVEAEIQTLDTAIQLQRRLNSLRNNPEYYERTKKLLERIGVGGENELETLKKKHQKERELAEQRHDQMLQQQKFEKQQLEFTLQMEEARARAAIQEAEIAQLKALQSKLAAEAAVASAIERGDKAAEARARQQVGLAERSAELTNRQISRSRENLRIIQQMGQEQRETLDNQHELARQQSEQGLEQMEVRQEIEQMDAEIAQKEQGRQKIQEKFEKIQLERRRAFLDLSVQIARETGAVAESNSEILDLVTQQQSAQEQLAAGVSDTTERQQLELQVVEAELAIHNQLKEAQESRLSSIEAIADTISRQNELLEMQHNISQSIHDAEAQALSLIAEMEKNPRKRQDLEERIAKIKLENLRKTQELEKAQLEMTSRRQELELRIAAIRNQAAQAQSQADIRMAEAEVQQVRAAGGSPEAVRAAQAQLEAAIAQGLATGLEGVGIQQQLSVLQESTEMQRDQLEIQHQMQEFQARGEYARSGRSIGRQRIRQRELVEDVENFYRGLQGTEREVEESMRSSAEFNEARLDQMDGLLEMFGGNIDSSMQAFDRISGAGQDFEGSVINAAEQFNQVISSNGLGQLASGTSGISGDRGANLPSLESFGKFSGFEQHVLDQLSDIWERSNGRITSYDGQNTRGMSLEQIQALAISRNRGNAGQEDKPPSSLPPSLLGANEQSNDWVRQNWNRNMAQSPPVPKTQMPRRPGREEQGKEGTKVDRVDMQNSIEINVAAGEDPQQVVSERLKQTVLNTLYDVSDRVRQMR